MGIKIMESVFWNWYENKYRAAINLNIRQKKKIKALNRQKSALSRWVKRLQRTNRKLSQDLADMTYEVCRNCNSENVFKWNVEYDGYKAYCAVCGSAMMVCSKCDKGLEACGACGFGYEDGGCLQEVSLDD